MTSTNMFLINVESPIFVRTKLELQPKHKWYKAYRVLLGDLSHNAAPNTRKGCSSIRHARVKMKLGTVVSINICYIVPHVVK